MIYQLKEKVKRLSFQEIKKRNKFSPFKNLFLFIAFTWAVSGWAQNDSCKIHIKGTSHIIRGVTTTTLKASGAKSYTWTPSTGLNITTGKKVVASPQTTTEYTVRTKIGCSAIFKVTVDTNLFISLEEKVKRQEKSTRENEAIEYFKENNLTDREIKKVKRLISESPGNLITFDFCQANTNQDLYSILRDLNLKKGDLFAVKIANINPYLYNINVTVKDDTIKSGTVPPLFSTFMDVSSLGSIASNLPALPTAGSSLITQEMENPNVNLVNPNSSSPITNVTNILYGGKIYLFESLTKLVDQTFEYEENKKKIAAFAEKKMPENDSVKIYRLIKEIETSYNKINNCYTNSILKVYNAQVDCFNDVSCFNTGDCDCLVNQLSPNIEIIERVKLRLIPLLTSWLAKEKKSHQADTTLYAQVLTELQSNKYSIIYLNKIYTKAYANFLIAKNMGDLSTYYSFPIQVQGDEIELKIDITPKAVAKTATDTTKNKSAASSNASTSSMSNQSPVTVNINTDTKTTPTPTPAAGAKATDPGAGKTAAAAPAKKDSSGTQDILSSDELKVSMPLAAREYHLNYKYRTSLFWYGFSTGFFADWLHDDNYINKPVTPNSSTTTYMLVQQSAKKNSPSQYGIMASVNGGLYFSKKHDWFGQVFAGPGLSIQTKLQPCLLIGGGVGCGSTNKFSVNAGMVIGQVQRLSADLDTGHATAAPQTISYYSTNTAAFFVSINYVFNF